MRKLINIDLYAKVMLTVIAACLVWISVRDLPIVESSAAQVASQPTSFPASTQPTTFPSFTKPDPRVVEAGAFVLLDEHGKKRAELAMGSGAPGLRFYDSGGLATRISITYDSIRGARIELVGQDTRKKPKTKPFRRNLIG